MALLIHCVDPLGNVITLTERRYRDHILGRHEGFTIDDIQNALEAPNFITHEPKDALINLYYRVDRFDGEEVDEVLKVCVRFRSDVGEVVSAYLVRGAKKGEIVLWKRP